MTKWQDPAIQEVLAQMSADGMSAAEIADAIGESRHAVGAALQRYGLNANSRATAATETKGGVMSSNPNEPGERLACSIVRIMHKTQMQNPRVFKNRVVAGACLQASVNLYLEENSFEETAAWLATLSEKFLLLAITEGVPSDGVRPN